MLFDNHRPRYLPHLHYDGILFMGLSPLGASPWIEIDHDLPRYLEHKRVQRRQWGAGVYRASPASAPAQRELRDLLLQHLLADQAELFQLRGNDTLLCRELSLELPTDGEEILWVCSNWIADDLVLMEEIDGQYCLTAASLCSPSHWRLEEKFGRPMTEIHDPIPGFHRSLTPRIDRFFQHLRPEHPVVRFNWSLQGEDSLFQDPDGDDSAIEAGRPLYYRTERQSLRRLPESGAIAFTIRVYIHPLESLNAVPGAMDALLNAVDETPERLAHYKGFDDLQDALEKYRT